jgi:hypothetical protein
MKQDSEFSAFEQRARSLLRDSAQNLDGATRARLTQARAAAISQRETRPAWFSLRYMAPAGAMATAVLATMLFMDRPDAPGVNDPAASALYDLELLADADAFELSQETDLEFIEWAASMGEQDKAGT